MRNNKSSLCFDCANHDCDWIQEDKPVKGWVAKPTIIYNRATRTKCEGFINSYCVRSCPEFKKYVRKWKKLDIERDTLECKINNKNLRKKRERIIKLLDMLDEFGDIEI